MSTRLTEHLINYGLSTAGVNALADSGYWELASLLTAVEGWRQFTKNVPGGEAIELYDFLNIGWFGPVLCTELLATLDRFHRYEPAPWAPNPVSYRVAQEIVEAITSGDIEHGHLLTPMSHVALQHGVSHAEARTAYRLLALRGYLAMRRMRPVALLPTGKPYQVTYCPSVDQDAQQRAASAVQLAAECPGLWRRSNLNRNISRALRPLQEVEYDDRARRMTVLVVDYRR